MREYEELVARAQADPAVVGLVLTGSHARGLATIRSDVDVLVVVQRRDVHWNDDRRSPEVDHAVRTLDELGDTSDYWQRYAFRGARVLLDRLGGGVAELVQRQSVPTSAEAAAWAQEGLDAYINFIYRATKSRRDGDDTSATLDSRESLSWLLTTVFALHGRLRPYNKYLRWELETYPLGEPWSARALLTRLLGDPAELFPDVEQLARRQGLGDVIDAWGDDLILLR